MKKSHPLKIFQATYGLSADQLGKKMNKSEATVFSYFKDETAPTMLDLHNLATHYPLDEVQNLAKNWLQWLEDKRNDSANGEDC